MDEVQETTVAAPIAEVYRYFSSNKTNGYTLGQFNADWRKLDVASKTQIRTGIGNGSFTY